MGLQLFLTIVEKNSKYMKKIEAIIRLSRFEKVRNALAEINILFFTMTEVKGFGLQKGEHLTYRGSSFDSDYIPRLQLEIVCMDEQVDQIVSVILSSAHTGEVGDGKIIVVDVEKIIRIRTSESGADAL